LYCVAAVAVAAGSGQAGCGGNGSDEAGKARANPHYGAPHAKVRIVSPKRGASVRAPVVVRVRVTGFTLDAEHLGKAPKRGSGQLHFSLDGGRYDRPRYSGGNGKLAARLGVSGRYSLAASPTITYRDLQPGKHRLLVSLANNDLSDTGVRAGTAFSVR